MGDGNYPVWLDLSRLTKYISTLECAIPYLKNHLDMIDRKLLTRKNPNPFPILNEHPEFISGYDLARRTEPWAIKLIEREYEKGIYYWLLCKNPMAGHIAVWTEYDSRWLLQKNPTAIEYFIKHPEEIDWDIFRYNSNPKATQMLLEYLKTLNKPVHKVIKPTIFYSSRRFATPVLEIYPSLIVPSGLVQNPTGIHLLTIEHFEKLSSEDVKKLMKNPGAVDFIGQRPYLIVWDELALNPNPNVMKILKKYVKQYSLSHTFWKNLIRTNHLGTVELLSYYIKTKEYKKHMSDYPSHHFWSMVAKKDRLLGILDTYLEENYGNIHISIWTAMLYNESVESVELFIKYKGLLDKGELKKIWKPLCRNPYAIKLLDQHLDWIDYNELSLNKRLFTYRLSKKT